MAFLSLRRSRMGESMHDIESTFQVGHVLWGQYTVIEVLGQGASGAVYLVKDERDSQKRFVLKEVIYAHRDGAKCFLFRCCGAETTLSPGTARHLQGILS